MTAQECIDLNGKTDSFSSTCNICAEGCPYNLCNTDGSCSAHCLEGYLEIKTGVSTFECIESCPLGYYYNDVAQRCDQCGENCVACS